MPAFVDAVDMPICKGVLTAGHYEYSCGLSVASVKVQPIKANNWRLASPGIFKQAHAIHHNATDHEPVATLYFTSQNAKLLSAICSCLVYLDA